MKMHWGLVRSLIILPGTALVLIPTVIIVASKDWSCPPQMESPTELWFWLALLSAGIGLTLASWSIALFMQVGKGTPAPWEPPQRLVIRGPYRYVRNPMISGTLFVLLAEAMFFRSWPIGIWMVIFFA
jgi:protein-S-isoprenylcysteine O-methyltransferase Ste14